MPLKIIVSGNLMSKLPKNWFLQKNISINDQRSADFRPFEIGNLTHKDVFQALAKNNYSPNCNYSPLCGNFIGQANQNLCEIVPFSSFLTFPVFEWLRTLYVRYIGDFIIWEFQRYWRLNHDIGDIFISLF